MQINRYINGEKTKTMPEKVENEAVKEVMAQLWRRISAADEQN